MSSPVNVRAVARTKDHLFERLSTKQLELLKKYIGPLTDVGCWLWLGPETGNGYGKLCVTVENTETYLSAHRASWLLLRGPIPQGLIIDHLCRNGMCVNPDHLELVTNRVNTVRGIGPTAVNASKTHCIRGHELSGPNLRVCYQERHTERKCLTCARLRWHAQQAKLRTPKGGGE